MIFTLAIFLLACCYPSQLTSAKLYKKVRLVAWVNNPPYYLSPLLRKDDQHRGMLLSILREAKYICGRHGLEIIDDNENHLPTHSDLINLITHNDTTEALKLYNITQREDELIIVGSTSYPHSENINKNFSLATAMTSRSLGVVVNKRDTLLIGKFKTAVSKCLIILYFAGVIAVLVSSLIWLFEHKINRDIPDTFGQGLWTCFWFCFVTMTTVGYGDYVIKRAVTRLICICWMVFGLMLTAMITATFLEEVQKTVDTKNSYVAALDNTSEVDIIRKQLKGKPLKLDSHESVLDSVRTRSAKVGLMDSNVVASYFNHFHPDELDVEREIKVITPVFIYLLSHNNQCENKKMVDDALMEGIKTAYIPPLLITPYHVRSISQIFDNRDNGLILYSTYAAACVIFLAILVEFFSYFLKKKRDRERHRTYVRYTRKNLVDDLKHLIKQLQLEEHEEELSKQTRYQSCCCQTSKQNKLESDRSEKNLVTCLL